MEVDADRPLATIFWCAEKNNYSNNMPSRGSNHFGGELMQIWY